jgi:triosephosphate isomerase
VNHPIFAANWKMNHGLSATRRFLQTFLSHYPRQYDRTMIFFPASVSITIVAEAVKHRSDIEVGAQSIHWEDQGAFTGEISASMAREAGASFTLVGHSERRHIFGETDEQCALKCAAAHRAGLTPLLCVGETLEEREKGETEKVVARQLRLGLSRLPHAEAMDIALAYEPVWAIGTGRNATPEDASAIHLLIRTELRRLVGERGGGIPILYGGSVNPGNVASLLAAPHVNGVLVGGASLEASSWSAISRTTTAAPEVHPELAEAE